ncbi:MAG: TOBE domain-containing protein [Mycoplasmoidaceae bacterium]|nr:TOBE domain-containing protein [Mycoplasmoidaceae bacterium]
MGNEKIQIGERILKYPITNKELEQTMKRNSEFKFLVRPEDVKVCRPNHAYLFVRVNSILYKGTTYEVKCLTKDKTEITLHTNDHLKVNDKIGIRWDLKLAAPIIPKKRDK